MSATAALQLKKSLADAIRQKLADDHMSISTFARKTGTGRHSVRRLLDGKNTAITLKTAARTADVLNLALSLSPKSLPLSDLAELAERYVHTRDDKEAARLEVQFLEGYYGKSMQQIHAKDTAVRSSA